MSISSKEIEYYKKQFGMNLKSIRESNNMTQFDLATAMNNLSSKSYVDKTSISRIENGKPI